MLAAKRESYRHDSFGHIEFSALLFRLPLTEINMFHFHYYLFCDAGDGFSAKWPARRPSGRRREARRSTARDARRSGRVSGNIEIFGGFGRVGRQRHQRRGASLQTPNARPDARAANAAAPDRKISAPSFGLKASAGKSAAFSSALVSQNACLSRRYCLHHCRTAAVSA